MHEIRVDNVALKAHSGGIMKRTTRKLSLGSEVIRNLTRVQLSALRGAISGGRCATEDWVCTNSCPGSFPVAGCIPSDEGPCYTVSERVC